MNKEQLLPDIREIAVDIKTGKHKKGEPYPEHDFGLYIGLNLSSKSPQICYSNEAIKKNIDEYYKNHPNRDEATYFYAEAHLTDSYCKVY